MDIAGKVALVTGGAGGLGEATVRRIVGDGGCAVIADFSIEKGEALADELGDAVMFAHTDVTDQESVASAINVAATLGELRVVVSAHGGPTALTKIVNRAGEPMPQEAFDRTISLYLSGTFNVMRQAAAAMSKLDSIDEAGRGVIINTASIAAFEGQVGQADYSAAKGGVVGLGLVGARDLASIGVRVMTIAPGTMFTPAFGISEEDGQEVWGKTVPFPKRMGAPSEYAELVSSIVRNDYLNGETIRLDGALRFAPK